MLRLPSHQQALQHQAPPLVAPPPTLVQRALPLNRTVAVANYDRPLLQLRPDVRQPRAGQTVQRVARQPAVVPGDDDAVFHDDDGASPGQRGQQRPVHMHGGTNQATAREERAAEAWATARPVHADELVRYAAVHATMKAASCALQLQELQQRADDVSSDLQQRHTCLPGCRFQIGSEQQRQVPVFGLTFHGSITVRTHTCQHCQQVLVPTAIAVGCFPSSAVDAQAWCQLELLETFGRLSQFCGVSAIGFADFLAKLTGYVVDGPVDDHRRMFTNAYYGWQRAAFGIDDLAALGVG